MYSIASTRYGDFFDGKTASFCVRRAVYYDPETGKEDPSKKGVCSNFLCDSKPGDKVQITGNFSRYRLELYGSLNYEYQILTHVQTCAHSLIHLHATFIPKFNVNRNNLSVQFVLLSYHFIFKKHLVSDLFCNLEIWCVEYSLFLLDWLYKSIKLNCSLELTPPVSRFTLRLTDIAIWAYVEKVPPAAK